jgi:uncharacterized protein YaiI (UPF0178 family)
MKIWVDGDACPVVIRDVLCKAAERKAIMVTFVANQALPVPRSKWIRSIQVASGYDAADNEIVARLDAGDLVITGDIPLASDAIGKGAMVISPRGDFMESMRASGVDSGGPPPLSQADRKTFAAHLDKWLQKAVNP